jgi:23S rRNA (uracil1939-C5)-methyltransferase
VVRTARQEKVSGYREQRHSGDLRHIVIRYGAATQELLLTLVTRTGFFPFSPAAITAWASEFPNLVGIVQSIQPQPNNTVLGREHHLVWGRPYYQEIIRGLQYRISHHAFFQVNPSQMPVLAEAVLACAGRLQGVEVWDLCCGVGFFSLELARAGAVVSGLEIHEDALTDAKFNARANGFDNIRFLCHDVLKPFAVEGMRAPHTMVLDPPRKGFSREALRALAALAPRRMIYVSCNPVSLGRDAAWLQEFGYLLKQAQPLDMFPHTYHVETVALFEPNS